jgi:2,4-dienoyl-CoA reductase-like NADH-dependent reductase (Old Yellow Enzyme family)
MRADLPGNVPNDLMAKYYRQRASEGGLMLTEATFISPTGYGASGGFDAASAEAILKSGDADLVAFGRHFLANPDLPERLRRNLSLNTYDRTTFYYGGEKGYADYPVYQEVALR